MNPLNVAELITIVFFALLIAWMTLTGRNHP